MLYKLPNKYSEGVQPCIRQYIEHLMPHKLSNSLFKGAGVDWISIQAPLG